MAFKMSGYSGYHGDKPAPNKKVGKTEDKTKESLLNELSNMKDPMNSNRGQNIVKQLMDNYDMTAEGVEAQVGNL